MDYKNKEDYKREIVNLDENYSEDQLKNALKDTYLHSKDEIKSFKVAIEYKYLATIGATQEQLDAFIENNMMEK